MLHTADWVLMGALLAVFIAQTGWHGWLLAAPARKMRREARGKRQEAGGECEGVSVLISARNEAGNLADYLPSLLTQDYPRYEVIIVDDGSEDGTRDMIERYMTQDSRLRTTFVPLGARVRSTKKLALTLGAKAAQYDLLLLTDADCVPESPHWISEMVKGFGCVQKEGEPCTKDVVLGFGAYFENSGHVNRLTRYDTLFNGLHYLGAAICGMPYMGVGRNLAYRKALFFETGGFTHLMTNCAGDDDLFVNHVATAQNTAVVVSKESLTWSPAKKTFKEWWQQKRRHLSVSSSYREKSKWQLAFEPVTRGLFYALLVASVVFFCLRPEHYITICFAVALYLVRWLTLTLILNISARRMGLRGFNPLSIQWFDIILPLINLWMIAVPKRNIKW